MAPSLSEALAARGDLGGTPHAHLASAALTVWALDLGACSVVARFPRSSQETIRQLGEVLGLLTFAADAGASALVSPSRMMRLVGENHGLSEQDLVEFYQSGAFEYDYSDLLQWFSGDELDELARIRP